MHPLFISRIRLNIANHKARTDLSNRDRMHKTLCQLVDTARVAGHILWRYETDPAPCVLVQSSSPPDLARLPSNYGTIEGPHHLAPHLQRLQPGQTVTFRLVANPIIKQRTGGRNGAKQRKAVPRSALSSWTEQRLEAAGLTLLPDSVHITANSEPHPRNPKARLYIACIDGHAVIDNPTQLTETTQNGIGASKTYGCGLITVSKPL